MIGGDAITIVRARGRRPTKVVHHDGTIDDYDQAKTVDLFERRLEGLADLEVLLRQLARRPDCAIVRAAIADKARTSGVRRLLHRDPKVGDDATLVDCPRRWLDIDIDNLARPPELAPSDLERCAEVAIAALPGASHGVSALVQPTAGHGIKPGFRLRLWYWLSRPVSGAELKCWLRNAPVDAAVFRAAQLVFTASPIYPAGAQDPLPQRLIALARRQDVVNVPPSSALIRPSRPTPKPIPFPSDLRANRYAFAALASAATHIARARQGSRHPALVSEACRLVRLIDRRLLYESDCKAALVSALRMAGVESEGRDAETEAVLAWALAHRNG